MNKILLTLVFGLIFSLVASAQVPVNPDEVNFQPLVNFDDVIGEVTIWFGDILKEGWLLFLSLFLVWFAFMCLKSFVDGKLEKRMLIMREHERALNAANRVAERKGVRRVERQRALENSWEVREFDAEYRSRELAAMAGGMYLSGTERFANINGDYYIRSESHDVVTYKTIEQWRAEREVEDTKPLDFDNSDYGRIYDSIVESDYRRDIFGVPLGKDEEYREYKELVEAEWELGVVSEPYEEEVDWDYEFESSDGRGLGNRLKEVFSGRRRNREEDDYGDDDFEREYGNRRGEFHGGY